MDSSQQTIGNTGELLELGGGEGEVDDGLERLLGVQTVLGRVVAVLLYVHPAPQAGTALIFFLI